MDTLWLFLTDPSFDQPPQGKPWNSLQGVTAGINTGRDDASHCYNDTDNSDGENADDADLGLPIHVQLADNSERQYHNFICSSISLYSLRSDKASSLMISVMTSTANEKYRLMACTTRS
jgi:hypothetical protein